MAEGSTTSYLFNPMLVVPDLNRILPNCLSTAWLPTPGSQKATSHHQTFVTILRHLHGLGEATAAEVGESFDDIVINAVETRSGSLGGRFVHGLGKREREHVGALSFTVSLCKIQQATPPPNPPPKFLFPLLKYTSVYSSPQVPNVQGDREQLHEDVQNLVQSHFCTEAARCFMVALEESEEYRYRDEDFLQHAVHQLQLALNPRSSESSSGAIKPSPV